ncbi:MAG TPA: hypothetical protein VHU87_00550 [Rhizomicrobium sp.]|jgi:hypothetical protein|nr:hypothetical protein [Rhizomicrobium sp.]
MVVPVHQADEDNIARDLPAKEARQAAISGRVVLVLVISLVAICVIFAVMWLTHANLG